MHKHVLFQFCALLIVLYPRYFSSTAVGLPLFPQSKKGDEGNADDAKEGGGMSRKDNPAHSKGFIINFNSQLQVQSVCTSCSLHIYALLSLLIITFPRTGNGAKTDDKTDDSHGGNGSNVQYPNAP